MVISTIIPENYLIYDYYTKYQHQELACVNFANKDLQMSQIKKLSAPNFLKIPWKFMSCLVCKAIFVFAVACKTLIFSHHPPGPNLFQNIRRIFISSGRRVQQRNITLTESRMCILFSEWPQQWSDGVYLDG